MSKNLRKVLFLSESQPHIHVFQSFHIRRKRTDVWRRNIDGPSVLKVKQSFIQLTPQNDSLLRNSCTDWAKTMDRPFRSCPDMLYNVFWTPKWI